MQGFDFGASEETTGTRFSFHSWPSTRLEAGRCVAPLGALYTPLYKRSPQSSPPTALPYDPISCLTCHAILNPYCHVDYYAKIWTCPFCLHRNHFPKHYADNITESNLPAELIPQYTTCEYQLQSVPNPGPPCFVFVVDTCSPKQELMELADSLKQTLNLLPQDCLVGLISFGTNVSVHELACEVISKEYIFRGNKEYSPGRVAQLLGCHGQRPQQQQLAPGQQQQNGLVHTMSGPALDVLERFLLPVSECCLGLESILNQLRQDPWPVPRNKRAARATGCALSVATSLLHLAMPTRGARIMLFTSGPCTVGPGAIVSRLRDQAIRSHADLANNKEPLHQPACEFFASLADPSQKHEDTLAVSNKKKTSPHHPSSASHHVVDVFACSLDQVGLLEMRELVEGTGGLMVMCDSFGQSVFKESLPRVFQRYPDGQMQMAFGASMHVLTNSREIKVSGAIGPVVSLGKSGPNVSELEIGKGGTHTWGLGGMDPSTTIAVYFEVCNTTPIPKDRRRYIQFLTRYQHANGQTRLRATTICGSWYNPPQLRTDDPMAERQAMMNSPVKTSFDQEAAAVLTARMAVHQTETGEVDDALRWVDRCLIRLCAKFAEYEPDNPKSFRLSTEFVLYPQLMFNFRRSPFLQQLNESPDEASYYRYLLQRENTTNSLVMIQPTLLSYSFNGPPQAVLLDAESVRPDTILLLDTFFHLVVVHGETIAAWREQGYHEQDEYAAFRSLLEAPQSDAHLTMDTRFPVPRYIVCDQGNSDARFLMARLNPSHTHNTEPDTWSTQVLTDDVSLRVFMEHLIALSVET